MLVIKMAKIQYTAVLIFGLIAILFILLVKLDALNICVGRKGDGEVKEVTHVLLTLCICKRLWSMQCFVVMCVTNIIL